MAIETRPQQNIALAISFIVLTTIAIGGRIWSRIVVANSKFGFDDLFCLLNYILGLALNSIAIVASHYGLGKHLAKLSFRSIETVLKIVYIGTWIYQTSVFFAKLSALCLYLRIFGRGNRGFNIAILVGFVFSGIYCLLNILQSLLACRPIRKNWIPYVQGHCIQFFAPYFSTAILDLIIDLYVLILPLPMIWRLRLKLSRKVWVAVALVVGYCTLITSTGRLVEVVKIGNKFQQDFTWTAFPFIEWTIAETNVGVIGLCLPAWFGLIRRVKEGGVRSLFHSRKIDMPSPASKLELIPGAETGHRDQSITHTVSVTTQNSSKTWIISQQ